MNSVQIYNGLRIVVAQSGKRLGVCKHCRSDAPIDQRSAFVILHGEELCRFHALAVIEEDETTIPVDC